MRYLNVCMNGMWQLGLILGDKSNMDTYNFSETTFDEGPFRYGTTKEGPDVMCVKLEVN